MHYNYTGGNRISNRRHIISCRINNDEYNDIIKVANQLEIKKSDVLKLCLNDSLSKYRPVNLTIKEKNHLIKIRQMSLDKLGKLSSIASELNIKWSRAGNNINQIAYNVNLRKGVVNRTLIKNIHSLKLWLSKNELIKQNNLLIRKITKLWQLLE